MSDLVKNWDNKELFEQQLELNLRELTNKTTYPPHWNIFLGVMKKYKPERILDIGCGCGAFYELCRRELPEIDYVGMDYSSNAIDLCRKTWYGGSFIEKDLLSLTESDIKKYDILHLGALLDVLPNGDEALQHLLSLSPKNILIGRIRFTETESFYDVYDAYNIKTYAYHHSRIHFESMCEDHGYKINRISNNIYLTK